MMQRWLTIVLLFIALAAVGTSRAQGNLLRDGDFEGTYTGRGRADLNIPADWLLWVATAPRTEAWMNLDPVAFPHNGPGPSPQSGSKAINFNRGYATFTVAIYQQVSVPRGTNVTGSGYAFLKTCNPAPNADNCGSAVESGAFTRVGIDPTGGTDPNSPSIVWSNNALPHDRWDQMTVTATAAADTVTFFMYVTQRFPAQINNAYFDNAVLTTGGAGGSAPGAPAATAAPPVPQFAPFVVAQGEQEDGSIVHTVQPGDTLDSIAVAYGVTRQDIMTLNDIRDSRIIQIGQQLIIRPPSNGGTSAEDDDNATGTPAATQRAGASPASSTPGTQVAAADASAAPVETTPPPPAPTARPLDLAALPTAPVRSAGFGSVLPAVDPATQTGQICALMFEDGNQNRVQDANEALLPAGSIVLVRGGAAVADHVTDGTEPYCFADLEAGDYIASLEAPENYGLTTPDQLQLRVGAGSSVTIAIGAAQGIVPPVLPTDSGVTALETDTVPTTTTTSPLLDNLGLIALGGAAVVLVLGGGLAFALRRR